MSVDQAGPGHYERLIGVNNSNIQHTRGWFLHNRHFGKTVLVEVNDAWAIGLYGRALDPKDYLNFLGNRWKTIVQKELTRNAN